ncbi:hypothetical protein Pcinc_007948 [Petrolisthes cinctipes]|uniref:Uncharacterized protein n=1 Tax=Petrolisthes cinctipes TaxID=88211 RepID=A0AAE1GA08_PETCI|nr:hypothetical protein Pcinc_007948 [Petrolisthes cinctipes]
MDQASYLIATPEPHRDHTYSSVSRDTTDASEPVDFGMQISQPVCHAETQTHEMFAHACAAEKNSVLRLSFKEKPHVCPLLPLFTAPQPHVRPLLPLFTVPQPHVLPQPPYPV